MCAGNGKKGEGEGEGEEGKRGFRTGHWSCSDHPRVKGKGKNDRVKHSLTLL